ncbi:hypothetical protein [Aurantiacibacter aquimixticola]|uniref:Uncharacterized protein n=1 Tax=Aurantiacibacter aquimixticola TaxID=1958945 RepID=A0A419RVX9_9SPHN|nr:hypothetical protein [Aurantiacibacter aquimixticola]RJY09938.1 hypothetical protein D6201_11800 [Aurantiacibacter aquimixticola]
MTDIFLLAFWTYLLGAIALGWRAGDSGDRKMILAICGAAFATGMANGLFALQTASMLVAVIDVMLLAAFGHYAMWSERHWPIWFVGIQAAICVLAGASLFVPFHIFRLDLIGGFWAVVALTLMAVGLLQDRFTGTKET